MDTLTRMADQLRTEKKRLMNELANLRGESSIQNSALDNMARKLTEVENELEGYKKTALIAQYDAIVAAISAFDYETNDERMEYGDWMRKETILTIITQHDPRNNK